MKAKEAIEVANKFRNSYYNSDIQEYREVANALDVLLPENMQLKADKKTHQETIRDLTETVMSLREKVSEDFYGRVEQKAKILRVRDVLSNLLKEIN